MATCALSCRVTWNGQKPIRNKSNFTQERIKHLIVIEGPTASGKTALTVALAKQFSTCVLSADSRQFYNELSIGTAKPTPEEMEGVPHFFIGSYSVQNEISSARYEQEALEVLNAEFKNKDVILLTGGSGMFIDALCLGLDPIPTSQELKDTLVAEHAANGLEPLLDELKKGDPKYFEEVDRNNPARIIRAVEVLRLTGKPYSEQRKNTAKLRPFSVHRFVINHPREILYARINERVDRMLEQGLLAEVQSVFKYRQLRALNTVGYSELIAYLEGNSTLPEAIENIKQNTRRYAKRQLTWFRRHEDAIWLRNTDQAQMLEEINTYLAEIFSQTVN